MNKVGVVNVPRSVKGLSRAMLFMASTRVFLEHALVKNVTKSIMSFTSQRTTIESVIAVFV